MRIPDNTLGDEDDRGLLKLAAAIFIGTATIAGLYFGRDVLIPVSIAILIAFVLGPVVTWLRRVLPFWLAVTVTVLAALTIVFLVSAFVMSQLADVASSVATYQANLRDKIQAIRKVSEDGGSFGRLLTAIAMLGNELSVESGPAAPVIRTRVSGSPLEVISSFVAPLLHPILTFGIVLILVVFILLSRAHISDQFVRLVGASDVRATSVALNDAARRVGRMLSLQLLTNFGFGLLVTVGLFALDMPNAALWGILGAVLRFVPYAGAILSAVLPTLIALAVMPGWLPPILVLSWIVICDILVGQIIEPLLFGESTGVSPLALVISAIFWGTIWGPVGLLMSTPLAICLLVLGKHVPQLAFLQILLSNKPALAPYQQVYHRLMHKAVADALQVATAEIEQKGLEKGLDETIGRMVALAEMDRAFDRLTRPQVDAVVEGTTEVLDLIESEARVSKPAAAPVVAPTPAASGAPVPATLVCIGGRGQIDNAAAALIASTLRQQGMTATALPKGERAPAEGPLVHVICYASAPTDAVRRYALRRLMLGGRATDVCHAVLNYGDMDDRPGTPMTAAADTIVGTLATICRRLTELAVSKAAVPLALETRPAA